MRRVAAVLTVLGVLVACGSSDNKAKSSDTTRKESSSTTAAGPDNALRTLTTLQAKLRAKGITTCAGTPSTPKRFYGIQGKQQVDCKVDGTAVRITVYASAADLARVKALAARVACATAKGKKSTYIASGTWLMGATFTANNAVQVNQKLGNAVGTKPTSTSC